MPTIASDAMVFGSPSQTCLRRVPEAEGREGKRLREIADSALLLVGTASTVLPDEERSASYHTVPPRRTRTVRVRYVTGGRAKPHLYR